MTEWRSNADGTTLSLYVEPLYAGVGLIKTGADRWRWYWYLKDMISGAELDYGRDRTCAGAQAAAIEAMKQHGVRL